jgi:hypothetical protein
VPQGSRYRIGTQGETTETTLKWLTEAAEAKRHSDNDAVIEREKERFQWRFHLPRFQQHLGRTQLLARSGTLQTKDRAARVDAWPRARAWQEAARRATSGRPPRGRRRPRLQVLRRLGAASAFHGVFSAARQVMHACDVVAPFWVIMQET